MLAHVKLHHPKYGCKHQRHIYALRKTPHNMIIHNLALFLSAEEPSLRLLPLTLAPFTKNLDCSSSGKYI
jgi:hypothetical protein